jgi:flagellar capping protein FliD
MLYGDAYNSRDEQIDIFIDQQLKERLQHLLIEIENFKKDAEEKIQHIENKAETRFNELEAKLNMLEEKLFLLTQILASLSPEKRVN